MKKENEFIDNDIIGLILDLEIQVSRGKRQKRNKKKVYGLLKGLLV